MTQKLKGKNCLFISILLFCFTITIFGPIELYYTNYEEFWFTRWDMFIVSALLFIVCTFLLGVVGYFLKGKIRDLYSCLIFCISIALYIQGNFANVNYGILNGDEVQWGTYTTYAIFDTLGWFLIIMGGGMLFGTYYLVIGLGVLGVSLWIAFSNIGKITLGNDGEKPRYGFWTWGSMVFTCGLAADILFYSLCEWISYVQEPHVAKLGKYRIGHLHIHYFTGGQFRGVFMQFLQHVLGLCYMYVA